MDKKFQYFGNWNFLSIISPLLLPLICRPPHLRHYLPGPGPASAEQTPLRKLSTGSPSFLGNITISRSYTRKFWSKLIPMWSTIFPEEKGIPQPYGKKCGLWAFLVHGKGHICPSWFLLRVGGLSFETLVAILPDQIFLATFRNSFNRRIPTTLPNTFL